MVYLYYALTFTVGIWVGMRLERVTNKPKLSRDARGRFVKSK